MEKLIFSLTMLRSRKALIQKHGKEFWSSFKKSSKEKLKAILPLTPKIGKSIFSSNYKFGPAYIAWYKTYIEMGE